MNPELTKIRVEPKTLVPKAVLKYNDGSERGFILDELRYRLGNCSEFQEQENAYQLAINYLTIIKSFLNKGQVEFADYVITRYNNRYENNKYVPNVNFNKGEKDES